jgi:succinate dehydrogenase / fumarate reductase, cytochrome b subunit
VLLPLMIWMFDTSVTSEASFEVFKSAFASGPGTGIAFLPGLVVKVVALALIWAFLHHFIAGVRHLWMDMTHSVTKQQGHNSAVLTMALSLLLTAALGAKLFGAF